MQWTTSSPFVFGYDWPTRFNAVHMALIPKGPYRGMVIVWNDNQRVAGGWPPSAPIGTLFQPYAIVDPADVPLNNIRYRNFLLPVGQTQDQDLFCAGHAWSQYGDLVIAGGTDYLAGSPAYAGGRLTYVWNPRLVIGGWPFGGGAFYDQSPAAGFFGNWEKGPDLEKDRWYPTAVLTHPMSRVSSEPGASSGAHERMLVFGGTRTSSPATPTSTFEERNSYEALVIETESDYGLHGLRIDRDIGSVRTWIGPGTQLAGLEVDWLDEYPRCHLLSDGRVFVSGYGPRWSTVDHDLAPRSWVSHMGQPGQPPLTYSSNWQHPRHDGSSVLFPNLGGTYDQIVRIGGAESFTGPTTDTIESIDAINASAWVPGPSMQAFHDLPDGGRVFLNVVILPTGALLALGGQYQDGLGTVSPVYPPMLFENGNWHKQEANPAHSRRTYHSTAVLLPDGRVFIGGGDDRDYDYEIFSPAYLDVPANRPSNVAWLAPAPFFDTDYGAHVLERDIGYVLSIDPLPLGQEITKVVLMAPCSVTHHSDMSQRYIELRAAADSTRVRFSCTQGETVVPRGIYMLFVVTNTSVSHAQWVMFQ